MVATLPVLAFLWLRWMRRCRTGAPRPQPVPGIRAVVVRRTRRRLRRRAQPPVRSRAGAVASRVRAARSSTWWWPSPHHALGRHHVLDCDAGGVPCIGRGQPLTKGQPPMRRTIILSGLVAALVGLGASTAAADRPDTGYHGNQRNDCAARDSRGRNLQVVGLVADGTLVCFRDDRPDRADADRQGHRAAAGLVRSSASTTARRTTCSTASATPAASTPSTSTPPRPRWPAGSTSHCPAPRSASTSTRPSTACGSSPTPARTWRNVDDGTTSRERHAEHPRCHAGQPGARHQRCGVHQQRRRPEHGDDAVRHRLDERPGRRCRHRRTPAR